jgi:peptidoglycan/LPS O-acetylase OafA/YrhL
MEKNIAVDWLRGLASLGVCLFHLVNVVGIFSKDNWFYKTIVFPIFQLGELGVPIFFVISGFVIPLSMYMGNYNFSKFFSFLKKSSGWSTLKMSTYR